MIAQHDLFDVASMAAKVEIPPAPKLVLHGRWPYPGLTPVESGQASWVSSAEYYDMLAAVIKTQGGLH